MDKRINHAVDVAWDRSIIRTGQPIVVVTGWRSGAGATNTMRVVTVPDRATTKKIDIMVTKSSGDLLAD